MVVIDEGEARGLVDLLDAGLLSDVREGVVAVIAIEDNAVAHGYGEIGMSVAVEVADCAGNGVASGSKAELLRRAKLEAAVGGVVVVADGIVAVAEHDKVGFAVAFEIDEAYASAELVGAQLGLSRRGGQGHVGEGDGDHGAYGR